jgi:outer membrane protein OmpA-like peptidoglycan-associated protein
MFRAKQSRSALRAAALVSALSCAFGPIACSSAAKPPAPVGEPNLAASVRGVTRDLMQQLGPAPNASRTLVIDPLLDGRTGQQTRATERVLQQLAASLTDSAKSVKILAFDSTGASTSRYVITGTVTAQADAEHFRLSIALSDQRSGLVVARAVANFREAGLDVSTTRFYNDSPSLVRDRSVEGYLKTAETDAGKPADALYIEQLPTGALLANAQAAYNAEKWSDALTLYKAAVQRKDGQQLRTFNGIYVTNVQLGNMKDAEDAFGKIAALGLATNNLAVKLLFRPGTTDFWPDPKVSGVYPMWLRQIAKAAQSVESCLNIIGHTSKSGSAEVNDRLSLARATAIRDRLEREVPGTAKKARVTGVGFRENLVGTGADDASDAVDRRVEFKVVNCTG